jgi:hypothetical protein
MRRLRLAAGLIVLVFGSTNLLAQVADSGVSLESQPVGTAQQGPTDPPAPADDKKWRLSTTAYVWFAGAEGKTDIIGPVAPVDLDLSFGDVIDAFKFAFMGAAEARRDRLVVLGDLTFIHLEAKKGVGIRDPDFIDVELDSTTAEVSLLGGYRVAQGPVDLDLLAGGRLNFFKATLDLQGPNRNVEGENKQTWLDPLIGVRARVPLDDKWSMALYGDLGGIVFGSDVTWQAVAGVDYQISHKMSVGAGWRYFKVKYDEGDFLYDVAQSGPMITFRTQFR